MRIERFRAKKVHGYLKFDVRFRPDLTFLTGINGSGKTTVVQSIVSLITPSLKTLTKLEFKELLLNIDDNGNKILIKALKKERTLKLSATNTEPFECSHHLDIDDLPDRLAMDMEDKFIESLEGDFEESPFFQKLQDLSLMFLRSRHMMRLASLSRLRSDRVNQP